MWIIATKFQHPLKGKYEKIKCTIKVHHPGFTKLFPLYQLTFESETRSVRNDEKPWQIPMKIFEAQLT